MAEPRTFDAAAYVADLRAAGLTVQAHPPVHGEPCFAILSDQGIGNNLLHIELKYMAAKKADPDAKRRVIDFLIAEQGSRFDG